MKRIALVLALVLAPVSAYAQCSGVFPAGTVCGAVVQGPPKPIQASSIANVNLIVGTTTIASGTSLRVLYDNAGKLGEYTNTQLTALINLATSTLAGALPAWPNNTTTYFRGDGTYATLNCAALTTPCLTGNQTITLSGDVSGIGATSILTAVSPNAITNAKLAQAAANTVKGNFTSATANDADNTMPSCADSGGNHLNYVSGTGLTCGTTSAGTAYVLLNTLTASSSISLVDTTSLTATYTSYDIVFINVIPTINATSCRFKVNVGGVQSSGYTSSTVITIGGSVYDNPTTYIDCGFLSRVANTGSGINGIMTLVNPSQTTSPKSVIGSMSYNDTAGVGIATLNTAGAFASSNAAVTGFQVDMSSGGIASGSIKIYGRL